MSKFIKPFVIIVMTIALTGSMTYAMQPPSQVETDNVSKTSEVKEKAPEKTEEKIDIAPSVPVESAPEPVPVAIQAPVVVPESKDNETIIWEFLIANGFTREQTAGIMGNLQQEHGFKTSDVAGGLGIAQWINGRRDALMTKANYLDLNVQLAYLMEELGGIENAAHSAILASTTVDDAVRAFQNKFERCGKCMESQRIQYAYTILGRH